MADLKETGDDVQHLPPAPWGSPTGRRSPGPAEPGTRSRPPGSGCRCNEEGWWIYDNAGTKAWEQHGRLRRAAAACKKQESGKCSVFFFFSLFFSRVSDWKSSWKSCTKKKIPRLKSPLVCMFLKSTFYFFFGVRFCKSHPKNKKGRGEKSRVETHVTQKFRWIKKKKKKEKKWDT